ncbi:MAG: protein kinase [Candidatus Brocadiae bacterium]|nr:protein kinase [Candidatus Brocadiia bacterium]
MDELEETRPLGNQEKVVFSEEQFAPGSVFFHYKIEKEIGRGGMGIVYKALDTKLQRHVAIKVILGGLETGKKVQRFLREAKAMAQLKHPHIVEIYEMGQSPLHYFVMEYVEGENLAVWFQNKKLSMRKIVTVLHKVTQAVNYAHKSGIIHRDIKPANILIDKVECPKIMDFGLAKMNEDIGLSCTGDVIGTPGYMSPEQAENKDVDKRSDIYSLGATLYEGLCGKPVFQGENAYNVMHQIATQDPVRPMLLNCDIPKELEAICLKCLEKKPERRYPNAHALGKDLQNFLENRPVMAKPASSFTYLKKFLIRNWLIALIVFSAACILITSAFFFIFFLMQEKEKATFAEREAKIAQAQGLVAKGNAMLLGQRWEDAIDEYQKARKSFQKLNLPQNIVDWSILQAYRKNPLPLLQIHVQQETALRDVAYTPDGRFILTAGNKTMQMWDSKTGALVRSYDGAAPFCLVSDGKSFFCNTMHKEIARYDLETGQKIYRIATSNHKVESIAFSKESNLLMYGSETGKVVLWNIATQKVQTANAGQFEIRSVAFDQNGVMAAAIDRYKAFVWDLKQKTSKEYHIPFLTEINYGLSISFLPGAEHLLLSTGSHGRVWDIKTSREIKRFSGHNQAVTKSILSPNERWILTSSADQTIRLWDMQTQKELRVIKGNRGTVTSIAFSPDSTKAASVSDDNFLCIWDLNPHQERFFLSSMLYQTQSLQVSPNELQLLIADNTGKISLYDIESGNLIMEFAGHTSAVFHVSFSPDGSRFASAGCDGTVRLWNINQGKHIQCMNCYDKDPKMAMRVLFSPDGKKILSGGQDGKVRLWDASTGKQILCMEGDVESEWIGGLAFIKDGKEAFSASKSGKIYRWDLKSGHKIKEEKNNFHLFCMTRSSNQRWLAYTSRKNIIEILDLEPENFATVYNTQKIYHPGNVQNIFFYDSDQYILTVGSDKNLKFWDRETRTEVLNLYEDASISGLALAPKKDILFLAYQDNSIGCLALGHTKEYEFFKKHLPDAIKKIEKKEAVGESYLVLANWYFFRRAWKEAKELYLLAQKQGIIAPPSRLFRCYWKTGEYEEALQQIQHAKKQASPDALLHLELCQKGIQTEQERQRSVQQKLASAKTVNPMIKEVFTEKNSISHRENDKNFLLHYYKIAVYAQEHLKITITGENFIPLLSIQNPLGEITACNQHLFGQGQILSWEGKFPIAGEYLIICAKQGQEPKPYILEIQH